VTYALVLEAAAGPGYMDSQRVGEFSGSPGAAVAQRDDGVNRQGGLAARLPIDAAIAAHSPPAVSRTSARAFSGGDRRGAEHPSPERECSTSRRLAPAP